MRALRFLILAALLSSLPAVAWADGQGDAYVNPDGTPIVEAEDTDQEPGGDDQPAPDDNCEWRVAVADDMEMAIYDVDGSRLYSETGRWFEKVCDGSIVAVGGMGIVPEGGAVDPRELAASAKESLPIADPPIATSPGENQKTYAQVKTWLWVDESWWTTYSATASAGRVSATVTASPTVASWSTGDGGSLDCAGPGVEWRRGLPEDGTYCSHVYRNSSAGTSEGTYQLGVDVAFDVTWTSSIGQGGSLGTVTRTSSRPIEVGEIQAIETE